MNYSAYGSYSLNNTIMKTRTRANILLALIILSTGLFCSSLFAQPPKGCKPPAVPSTKQVNEMIDELSQSLKLSSDQERQLREEFTNHFEELRKLQKSEQTRRDQMKAKHDELRDDFQKQINSILDKEQMAEFHEKMKKHKPKGEPSISK